MLDFQQVFCHFDVTFARQEFVKLLMNSPWMILNKITCILLVGISLSQFLLAGDTKIAKYAGEFLSLGVGGRELGMGSTAIGLCSDVTSGYWNPAGLSRIMYPEVIFMHDEGFGGLENYDYGAVAIPYGGTSSFGISVMRLGVDGIPDTRNALVDASGNINFDDASRLDDSRITYFSSADWAFYGTYAQKSSDELSYGVNIKFIHRSLAEATASGVGFDIGAQYRPSENILLGAVVQDVTTTLVAWSTGSNELISPTLRIGGGYVLPILGGVLIPAIDSDVRFENRKTASTAHIGPVSFDMRFGVEYSYKNIIAVRGGYTDIKQLTLGAGLHLPKLNIDYSFAEFNGSDQLGNTHRISLKLTLDADKYKRSTE